MYPVPSQVVQVSILHLKRYLNFISLVIELEQAFATFAFPRALVILHDVAVLDAEIRWTILNAHFTQGVAAVRANVVDDDVSDCWP